MKKTLLLLANLIIGLLYSLAQNTGVNTNSPLATLDVNGDIALRIATINLANATNADVNTTANKKSAYRITNGSPLGYSISGFTGGVDGRIITIINASTSQMALDNDGAGNASAPANRILTSDGNSLYIPANGAVTIMYDITAARWRVSSFSKPAPFVPDPLWYMDGSSNMYNLNNGKVGIGTVAPANKLTVNGNADVSGNMGIGNANPQAKLDVAGTVKITDGTQGAGKVLTSDANGTASWQASAATSNNGSAGYGSWGDCSVNNISEFNPVYNAGLSNYGYSAADMDGNYAVLGAYLDTVGTQIGGVCYLYFFNGSSWVFNRKIPNPDPANYDFFGSTVAISGDNIIIGAYGDDGVVTNQGAAYIYKISTNTITKIKDPANAPFGRAVGISGNLAIIGCPFQNYTFAATTVVESGVVYIYNIATGIFTKVNNPNNLAQDHFGATVAIDGNKAVIGAPDANAYGSTDCGIVYYYNVSNNTTTFYTNASHFNNAHYGNSVSISGNTILASWGNALGGSSGKVDVLTVDNVDFAKLQPLYFSGTGTSGGEGFGNTLKISGNYALITAPYEDGFKGSASIYQNINGYWILLQKFKNPAAYAPENFGLFSSVDGSLKRFLVTGASPVVFFGKVNN